MGEIQHQEVPNWAFKSLIMIMPVLLTALVGFSGWIALSVSQLNARVGVVIEAQGWHEKAIIKNEDDITSNAEQIDELKKRLPYK